MHTYTHARTQTHTQKHVILIAFPRNNGFVNMLQYYVIRTLPVLLRNSHTHTLTNVTKKIGNT